MGIQIDIDRTLKCHPEISGEDIDYTWAQSKIYLWNTPIAKEKRLTAFHSFVDLSLSQTKWAQLTKHRIMKFNAHVRDYMAAYLLIFNQSIQDNETYKHKSPKTSISKVDANAYGVPALP